MVRASIFIACKIYQCPLRTTVFIQSKPYISIEQFHAGLTKVVSSAKLELSVLNECRVVEQDLSMKLRFYDKFVKVWESLGIKDRTLQ